MFFTYFHNKKQPIPNRMQYKYTFRFLLGLCIFTGGFMALILPETLGSTLPDTFQVSHKDFFLYTKCSFQRLFRFKSMGYDLCLLTNNSSEQRQIHITKGLGVLENLRFLRVFLIFSQDLMRPKVSIQPKVKMFATTHDSYDTQKSDLANQ